MEVKKYLPAFEKYRGRKIIFKSFDINFYDEFIEYLTYDYVSYRYTTRQTKGIKTNTMDKTFAIIPQRPNSR